ncbi:MAG TPA: hypothetical protein VMT46_01310 [Anaerolineaceae bacterium]|nr:hypothetical protein [Anaerolineaceae bacterium]
MQPTITINIPATFRLSVRWFYLFVLVCLVVTGLVSAPVKPVQAFDLNIPADMNKSFSPISISAGGISTLTVTMVNSNSFALTLSTDPAAWTDTLPAGMSFANPPDPTTTCGGTVLTMGNKLSLVGGNVPAKVGMTVGTCLVTVKVTSITPGNLVNTIAANTLIATDPSGLVPITNQEKAEATLQVSSVQPPSLNKTFAPNTVWVGQNSLATITIRNTDTAADLTGVNLTDHLPAGVTVTAAPTSPQCGGTVTSTATSIAISGGTVPKQVGSTPGTCQITFNVKSVTPGIYTNLIPANALQTNQGVTNAGAASAPLNVQSIGLTKAFSPGAIQAGGTSTLTITLRNPSAAPYTGVGFTDNLPVGMSVYSAPVSPQCGGAVTSTASSITLAGGTIPAGDISTPGSCTVSVEVTAATPATYTNRINSGSLATDQGATNTLAATANLTVYTPGQGMGGSKSFNPSTIAVGGISHLTINVTAPADSSLTSFSLSDALPAWIVVANPPAASKNANCGAGMTFAPSAGDTLLVASGGTIPAAQTCTLAVDVVGTTTGVFTNTISAANISNTENRNVSGNFSATLTVSGLSVGKSFTPTTVNPNGISTLTIQLTNTNTSQVEGVSLTDNLPGAVRVAAAPNASTTCGGGILSASPGSALITLSGGVIPAQVLGVPGTCTINVDVTGGITPGTFTNSIGAGTVSGTIHATSTVITNPQAASANLTVQAITIGVVKGFNPVTVFGGSSSKLTVQLSNPNNVPLLGIAFSDNLPAGGGGQMTVANPPNASVGTCGGILDAIPGTTSFSFSGGSLAPNVNCFVTLDVTMDANSNLVNTIPIGAVTTSNGATNPQAASATLTNQAGASVRKYFSPNPILAGGVSTLTIEIQNTSTVLLSGLGLIDTLPGDLTVADNAAVTTCNDPSASPDPILATLTAAQGENAITMSGGILHGMQTCTITVHVLAPSRGSFKNCIEKDALVNDQDASNDAQVCDTLEVETLPDPPVIAKAFSPASIPTGGTSALRFTLTNPTGNTVSLTGVGFSDTFPAGLSVASLPITPQCGGTVSSTTNSISLSGGTIAPNNSCTVAVSVTAAAGGSYPNTSGAVTSTNGGTGNTASATLAVVAPPAISKAFSPDTIAVGEVSTLAFTLTNPNLGNALTGVAFTDAFPAGLRVAGTPNIQVSGCGSPVFAPTAGATGLGFSGGSIAAGGSCTASVDVTGFGGSYVNTTSAVTSINGGAGNTASDTLDVTGWGLSLTKVKSSVRTGFRAGDTIDYTYTLTNTGDVTLTGPGASGEFTITDNKTTAICPAGTTTLASGESVNCTASYAVQPADVTARVVTNTAVGHALFGATPVDSNPASATVVLEALTFKKTSLTPGYRQAGDTLTYSYTLTNTGSVTLSGTDASGKFLISDDHIAAPFTCDSATSLAPGANVSCTAAYIVKAADVTAKSVTNVAVAAAKDPANQPLASNPDSATVHLVAPPVITKAFSPASIPVGTNSLLTFTVDNPAGNTVPLVGVGFTDVFPAGLAVADSPDAAQCGGTVTSTSSSITLTGGTVMPDGSCTVMVSVTAAVPGDYANTSGAVTSTNGGLGNTASATLTVVAPPVIGKSFSPDTIGVGGVSTLFLSLINPNPAVVLTSVGFTDPFPGDLHVAATPNIQVNGCGSPAFAPLAGATSLTFSGGTIAAGGTCSVSVDVTGSGGNYVNTTSVVTSTNGGTGATSNPAALLIYYPELTLSKSIAAGDPYSTLGGTISYDYILRNTGNVTLIGNGVGGLFTVTDDRAAVTCPATPAGLAPGDQITCTASYTVTQADLDVGQVTNQATAHARFNSTDVPSNQDTKTANANQNPALNLVKSIVSGNPYKVAGGTIRYGYQLTNTGNITLKGGGAGGLFTISDDHTGAPFTCGSATSLAPGASVSCMADYNVLQADVDRGYVTNKATGAGKVTDQSVTGNANQTVTSNEETQTAYVHDLAVVKTDNVSGVAVLKKPFTWAMTVSSIPPARAVFDAGETILSDPLPATATYGSPTLVPGANVTGTVACAIVSKNLTCTASGGPVMIGTDQSAGSLTVSFSATPDTLAPLSNTATANPDRLGEEIDTTDNTSTDDLTVTAPDLVVTKSNDAGGSVLLGAPGVSTFQWTLRVENHGDASATFASGETILSDALPAAATYAAPVAAKSAGVTGAIACSIVSKSLTCTASGGTVTIPIGSEYFTVTFGVTPTAAGNLTNHSATVDPDDCSAERDETNNTAADTVVVHAPDLIVIKTNNVSGSVLLNLPGTPTFQWNLKVENVGDASATFTSGKNIFTDTLPGAATYPGSLSPTTSPGLAGAANISCSIAGNGLTCAASGGDVTLAPNEWIELAFDVAPTAFGSLVNSATVDPDAQIIEGDETNNTASNTVVVHAPNVRVAKTNDTGSGEVLLGRTFQWMLKVDNVGDAAATFASGDTILTDALPGNANYAAPTLGASTGISGVGTISCGIAGSALACAASGGPVTIAAGTGSFTLSFVVTPSDVGNLVNNPATVDPDGHVIESNESDNTAANTVKVTIADLTVTKSDGSLTYVPGATTTYTIVVGNTGDGTVANAQLSDALPPVATRWTWTCGAATGGATGCTGVTNSTASFTDAINLPPGSTITYTVVATTNSAALTNLVNTAVIDPPAGVTEKTPADNTATDTDTPDPHATLTVGKADGVTQYTPGQSTLTYTVTIGNNGPSDATGATLTDAKPSQLASWSWTCTGSTGSPTGCDGGASDPFSDTVNLPAGSSLTYTVTTPQVASNQTGNLVNTATLSSPISTTVTATDTDTPNLRADLWVTKTDGVTSYVPGQSVLTYTVTIGNDGPSDVIGTTLTDTKPAKLASWSWTCTGSTGSPSGCDGGISVPFSDTVNLPAGSSLTYTVTTPMVAADQTGNLSNVAAITAPGGVIDPNLANNSVTDTDAPDLRADLSITKTDSQTGYTPGVNLTYTVTVSNAGPSAVVGAVVTDNRPSQIASWSWTCSGTDGGASGCTPQPSSSANFSDSVDLPVGGSITYSILAMVPSNASGNLVNTITVTPPGGVTDADLTNNTATDTDTPDPQANLSVTKNDGVSLYVPGTTLTYTIIASNAGPSDAPGVVLNDAIPARFSAWTWVCGAATGSASGCDGALSNSTDFSDTIDLPVGSSQTYTVTAQVKSDAIGDLANTVSLVTLPGLTETTPGDNRATDTDMASPMTDLALAKSNAPAALNAGENMVYTLTVTNNGPSDQSPVSFTDTLPAEVSYTSFSGAGWSCNMTAGKVHCSLPYLASGANSSVDLTAQVRPGTPAGTIQNTAELDSNPNDPDASNNTASSSAEVGTEADLSVVKSVTGGPFSSGDALAYTLTIANAGPSDALAVSLSDPLPAGAQYISASGTGWTCAYGTLTHIVDCTLPGLPAGGSTTVTVNVLIAQSFAGQMDNTAAVSASTTDPNPENNTSASTVIVQSKPIVTATKTATLIDQDGDGLAGPGDQLEYTVSIANSGSADALNVVFSDTPGAHTSLVDLPPVTVSSGGTVVTGNASGDTIVEVTFPQIPAGGHADITFQVRIDSPLPAGVNQVSNQGLVEGNNFPSLYTDDPQTEDIPDDPTVIPVSAPNVVVTKTAGLVTDANGDGLVNPGDTLRYTIHVRNTGRVTASGLSLADTPDPNTSLVIPTVTASQGTVTLGNAPGDDRVGVDLGSLAPDADVTITFEARVHPAPLPKGVTTISNQAVASGTNISTVSSDDPGTSPPADPTVTIISNPTAVTLLYFRADPFGDGRQVRLSWATAAEIDNYGFYLYRAAEEDLTKAEEIAFLPAKEAGAQSGGAEYEYLDTPGEGDVWFYWLADVNNKGVRTYHSLNATQVVLCHPKIYLPLIWR